MSKIQYFPPMFERLTPRTPWAGGRMVDTDVLTLAEAASMATKHAGEPVTIGDFLPSVAIDATIMFLHLRCGVNDGP